MDRFDVPMGKDLLQLSKIDGKSTREERGEGRGTTKEQKMRNSEENVSSDSWRYKESSGNLKGDGGHKHNISTLFPTHFANGKMLPISKISHLLNQEKDGDED